MTDAPPFFIVASARSGTTFLRLTLASHPQVAIPPESDLIVRLYRGHEVESAAFLEALAAHPRFRAWSLPIEDVRDEIGSRTRLLYAEAVSATFRAYARWKGKERWGDETPAYVEHIPLLARLFPEARFIHVVQDGRNVALSYSHVDLGPRTLAKAARLWRRRVLTGIRDGRALPPGRYLEIRSEDLADDPQGEARDICDFLGLGFDPLMFDEEERARWVDKEPERGYEPKVGGGERMSSWPEDMPAGDIEVFEAIAGDALSELGYERRFPQPSASARLKARLGEIGIPLNRLR